MMTTLPFSAGNRNGEFRFFPGVVLSTDQRSDSFVSGSGRTFTYEGTGGGSSQVSTQVLVARDIWLRDAQGDEHHVRIQEDVPLRAGQHIALVYFRDTSPKPKLDKNLLVSIFSLSTNQSYSIGGGQAVTALMDPKTHDTVNYIVVIAWVVSLILCIGGVGFLGVFALLIWHFFDGRRQKVITAQVSAEVAKAHQVVLDTVYSERAKLAATLDQPGQPRLGAGPAV